jgi:hypothetical protein
VAETAAGATQVRSIFRQTCANVRNLC